MTRRDSYGRFTSEDIKDTSAKLSAKLDRMMRDGADRADNGVGGERAVLAYRDAVYSYGTGPRGEKLWSITVRQHSVGDAPFTVQVKLISEADAYVQAVFTMPKSYSNEATALTAGEQAIDDATVLYPGQIALMFK